MIVIVLYMVCIVISGIVASHKNRSVVGWILLNLFLSPLCLLVLLALSPLHGASAERKCPSCAEWVNKEAVVCKHCGKDLPKKSTSEVASIPLQKAA